MWPDGGLRAWLEGVRRWWWVVAGLPALTAALWWARPPTIAHDVVARLTVAVDVETDAGGGGRTEGTAAEVGEALIDDLSRIVPGAAFAAAVNDRLPASIAVRPGEISGAVSAEDRHRVTDISVRRPAADRAALARIAAAVGAELAENGGAWAARLGTDDARLSIVDGPHLAAVPPTLADRLALPLRLALAVLAALGLAVLLHATDPVLRRPPDATAAVSAPILATVPRRARRRPVATTEDRR